MQETQSFFSGSNFHVCRLYLVDFDACFLFHFVVIVIDHQLFRNVLLFSCNPIGQLCLLGGPGYSSRTVILYLCVPE